MSDSEYTNGIAYPYPFAEYTVALCDDAMRHINILSPQLDHAAFDTSELVEALSALARRSRQARVRILISDARPLVTRGHRLLQLARRLPSTVHIRKLEEHPNWNNETLVIKDRDGVLYKPGGSDHDAFYEPDSRVAALRHLELFEELWRFGVEDAELRSLYL